MTLIIESTDASKRRIYNTNSDSERPQEEKQHKQQQEHYEMVKDIGPRIRRNRKVGLLSFWFLYTILFGCFPVLVKCTSSNNVDGLRVNKRNLQQKQQKQQRQQQQQQRYAVKYYNKPMLHWMTKLPNDEELFQGNEIVESPFDKGTLYITTQSGNLMVLSAIDGSTKTTVIPTVQNQPADGGGAPTFNYDKTCSSGISFGRIAETQQPFLVYSIVDHPPLWAATTNGSKTRVIAVSIPNHEILWESAGLPGEANGSPVIYKNRENSEHYTVLTHNSQIVKPDGDLVITGHLTVLQTRQGHVVWTESEWARNEIPKGYGPPAIANNPIGGKYTGGMTNKNAIVVWASSEDDGRSPLGYTYSFQFGNDFLETFEDIDLLKTTVLKKVRWSSISKPALSRNGTNLFFGVTGSEVRGWNGDTRFDETANWAADLVKGTSNDPFAPIPSSPTLSVDESRLFVSSASTDMVCVDTLTGKSNWRMSGTSPFLAETRGAPDDSRIYVIQSADGRIFCHDQETGALLWFGSCDQFEEDCANSVRANFALSQNGQFLFYGDVIGRVIALRLGDLEEIVGTSPTTPGAGTSTSTEWGDGSGVLDLDDWNAENNNNNLKKERSGPTIGVIISLVLLAAFAAFGGALYIFIMNKYKTIPHPQQEPSPSKGGGNGSNNNNNNDNNATTMKNSSSNTSNAAAAAATTEEDYSLPSDFENAPDPYEDSMIVKHKRIARPTSTTNNNNNTISNSSLLSPSGSQSKSFDDSFDNGSVASSHAPADRISRRLGTTNRITPIKEDFSYGASVLV